MLNRSFAGRPGLWGPAAKASRSLGLDTTVTVRKPLFDLLHAGLLAADW